MPRISLCRIPVLIPIATKSQVGTVLFFVGCPDTTVAEARKALVRRRHLEAFAAANQADDAAAVRIAFVRESATWP